MDYERIYSFNEAAGFQSLAKFTRNSLRLRVLAAALGKAAMKTSLDDRFASKLKTPEDAPEPLRSKLVAALHRDDAIQLLVFAPAERIVGEYSPATLLAVLDHEWIFVTTSDDQSETPVVRCRFSDTLLLEITEILLYGKLRFDFVCEGRVRSVAARYNTVMEGLFETALQLILNGMDGVFDIEPVSPREITPGLEMLPLKFANAVMRFLPMGQTPRSIVYWPSVCDSKMKILHRELTPETVLVLTDRELICISEEKDRGGFKVAQTAKFGAVATHCLLSRVEEIKLSEREPLDMLDVLLKAGDGREKLKFGFPPEIEIEVSDLVAETGRMIAGRRVNTRST